jgi:geranylgeranyl diphosphate synthase type I
MLDKIKKNIEKTLSTFADNLDRRYGLKKISPFLHANVANFLRRSGKRVRPLLFTLSYLGYSRRPAKGIYESALGLELLHAFLLIHDDIIDKSSLRKGEPAMHTMLDRALPRSGRLKFTGSDLAIVVGDIIYAMAIDAFLSIGENPGRKLRALKRFIQTAIYTGSGEFVELLAGTKQLKNFSRRDIDIIYDLKTAYYTFCSPLTLGAILAGAKQSEINKLTRYGILLGRAFQIKDDILDMFGSKAEIGKSPLTDIKEGKKTLLVWYAFRHASATDKKRLQRILTAPGVTVRDLRFIRQLVIASGALDYAKTQISTSLAQATQISASLAMRDSCRDILLAYPQKILAV